MLFAFDQSYCGATDPGLDHGYNASACGIYKPPTVISISYVWNEAEFSDHYLQRQCLEFLKLGLQGVTILAATGDWGTADQMDQCVDTKTGALNFDQGSFSSVFPASCPWVTAVGGTQLEPTNTAWAESLALFPPETVFNQDTFSSGGGFSRIFRAPKYQASLVASYLNLPKETAHLANLSSRGYFNRTGRGYPDVSLMASNYTIALHGSLHSVSGTSASTPVLASMIAKINNARLRIGKSAVGFINPVLYKYRDEITRDVQTGFNHGCGVSRAFPATEGWDAATGLGSLDYSKLLKLYIRLP